jgi:hypothetical protein
MKYKALAASALGLLIAVGGATAAYANGAIDVTHKYSIIHKTTTHGYKNLHDVIGGCARGTSGVCHVTVGKSATNTFGTSLGITVDELASILNVSTARTQSVSVGCASPKLKRGQGYRAYSVGTLYRYKIREYAVVGTVHRLLATSGWKTTYKASASTIYCKVN